MIPISDLMQVTHPGYNAFRHGMGMRESQFPVFLDYCVCVCERFRHYANQYSDRLVTENSLFLIIDCIREMDETDDPEYFFPLRNRLREGCEAFQSHCSDMSKCFKTPMNIGNFYEEMGELVKEICFAFAGVTE